MQLPVRLRGIILIILLSLSQWPVTAFAADLSVTATVPANADDYTISLTSNASTATVGQNTSITYTLTYGTTLAFDTPVTIEASWSRGTLEGNTTPSVDIVSYVPGSATTNAYTSSPVVDTVNQTISWTISSLPPATQNQNVSFILRTSSSYVSTTKVNFTVSANLNGPGVVTSANSLTTSFRTTASDPTPTSTPAPTNTPTPKPTSPPHITPTPTPRSGQLNLSDVEIRTITPTSVSFAFLLSKPAPITLRYGESPTALTNTVSDSSVAKLHEITVDNLTPLTSYYFQVASETPGERIVNSEVYTVITAQESEEPTPVVSTFVATSNNTILTSPATVNQTDKPSGRLPALSIPTDTLYEFHIAIPNSKQLTHVQAIVRSDVLGHTSLIKPFEASTEAVDLLEITPGVFAGKLKTTLSPGSYSLYLRISDKHGRLTEKKIASLKVVRRFTILDKNTRSPIEAARVLIRYWNSQTNSFELLRSEATAIPNPSFTQHDGTLPIILPGGKYEAQITSLQYKKQTVTFTIQQDENSGYPEVLLEPDSFQLLHALNYYKDGLVDVFIPETLTYLAHLSISQRILRLASVISLISLCLILGMSLILRLQISPLAFPAYLWYIYTRLLRRSKTPFALQGVITDATSDQPISHVYIYVRNAKTNMIISHAVTRSNGEFAVNNLGDGPYTLSVVKHGYQGFVFQHVLPQLIHKPLHIALSSKLRTTSMGGYLLQWLSHVLSSGFELILFLCFILLLTIGLSIGFSHVALSLVFAFFNLTTWILHMRHYRFTW